MSASEGNPSLITRRRLAAITAAGGSALVLSACGSDADPNADRSDAELLGFIRELQSEIADGYAGGGGQQSGASQAGGDARTAAAFADQSQGLLDEIDKAFDDLGESAPEATFTSTLDVQSTADLEPFLVGVTNAVVPDLSSEKLRLLAYEVSLSAAGRIAATARAAGEDPAPKAFVLGDLPPGFEGTSA